MRLGRYSVVVIFLFVLFVATRALSSLLSLASSGAVVKWDVLDDMGNYFLMLGCPWDLRFGRVLLRLG